MPSLAPLSPTERRKLVSLLNRSGFKKEHACRGRNRSAIRIRKRTPDKEEADEWTRIFKKAGFKICRSTRIVHDLYIHNQAQVIDALKFKGVKRPDIDKYLKDRGMTVDDLGDGKWLKKRWMVK